MLFNSAEFIYVVSTHRHRRECCAARRTASAGWRCWLMARDRPAATIAAPHFAPKAKSVIFLFMDGGPSQIDTFDPKPRLDARTASRLPFKPPTTVFNISDKILRLAVRVPASTASAART